LKFFFQNRYKVAKRDNDSVYFEKVPTLSSLPAIQGILLNKIQKQRRRFFGILFLGAIVAKPQPFDCHDTEVCGVDIFQKLVPLVIMKFDTLKKKIIFYFLGYTFSCIGI